MTFQASRIKMLDDRDEEMVKIWFAIQQDAELFHAPHSDNPLCSFVETRILAQLQ